MVPYHMFERPFVTMEELIQIFLKFLLRTSDAGLVARRAPERAVTDPNELPLKIIDPSPDFAEELSGFPTDRITFGELPEHRLRHLLAG